MYTIAVMLLTQFLWLYAALKYPDRAQSVRPSRMAAALVVVLTLIIVNDWIALYAAQSRAYNITIKVLFVVFSLGLLSAYISLYYLFHRLIKDRENLSFLSLQMHVFFISFISMQVGRIGVQAAQTWVFLQNRNQDNPELINQLEWFNIVTECLFNVLILYYFVRVAGSPLTSQPRQKDHSKLSASMTSLMYQQSSPKLQQL